MLYLFERDGWNITNILDISKFIHINIIPLIYKLTEKANINVNYLVKIIKKNPFF